MVDKKQESLIKALSYCSLRDLPKEDDGENIWIKAIILLSKNDCSQNYAYAVRGEKGTIRIIRDFGSSIIYKIESIHPFEFLDSAYMPTFKNANNKDEKIGWLKRYSVEACSDMKLKELNIMVIDQAIKNNLKALQNE